MATTEGTFVWYELMTEDVKAAEAFYAEVVGWHMVDSGHPGMTYTLACLGETRVAGIMALSEELRARGASPRWMGFVAVADVDAKSEEVVRLGGAVQRPPQTIPGVGRFGVGADPQGAPFVLFRGEGLPQPRPAPGTPGLIGWHELYAHDWQAGFAFYEALFGWQKDEAIDIGPMGTYQLFRTKEAPAGSMATGGMMSLPGPPAPSWLYYVIVEDIDAAGERLTGAGGAVRNGPVQVPGGMWIIQASDPQGVDFAIVGNRAQG